MLVNPLSAHSRKSLPGGIYLGNSLVPLGISIRTVIIRYLLTKYYLGQQLFVLGKCNRVNIYLNHTRLTGMPTSPPFNVRQQCLLHWCQLFKKLLFVSMPQLTLPVIEDCGIVTQFDHIIALQFRETAYMLSTPRVQMVYACPFLRILPPCQALNQPSKV